MLWDQHPSIVHHIILVHIVSNEQRQITTIWMYYTINDCNQSQADFKLCLENIKMGNHRIFKHVT